MRTISSARRGTASPSWKLSHSARRLSGRPPMNDREKNGIAGEHFEVTRRVFLALGGAAATGLTTGRACAQHDHVLQGVASRLEYLTSEKDFGNVERGNPLPWTLPESKLREIGMTRDTWKLDVVPEAGSKVGNPMSRERGNALDFAGLMKLAETRAVRYLKVMTCNNLNAPLGMG